MQPSASNQRFGPFAGFALPELPDVDWPELPNLPEFAETSGPTEPATASCPVCDWIEANVCRPYMKEGDSKECAKEIFEKRIAVEPLPREVRIKELGKVFAKFGIPVDIRLERRRG